MWIGCGIDWVWIVGLVVTLRNRRGVSYTLYNLGNVAGTCGESRLYLCCILYNLCGFVCKWLYTRLIQSIRVLSECDYISLVDCYIISATTSIFLSSVVTLVSSWSTVSWSYHDKTSVAWPLIWYNLIALNMFFSVVTGSVGRVHIRVTECCVVCEWE